MSEATGLDKPLKLKKELAEMLGSAELSRLEINKKLWDYIKANKLQAKKENGKGEGAGAFIVVDKTLLPVIQNTNSTNPKNKKVTDLRTLKEGQTIHMMQLATIISANVK